MRVVKLFESLLDGENVQQEEASHLMMALLTGELNALQIAAMLGALRTRPISPDVLAGFSQALLMEAVALPGLSAGTMDCCGTGGDGAGLVNVSTAVAFVLAAAGVKVLKHGNRGVSSSSGSSDLLQALDVNVGIDADAVRQQYAACGLGFIYAPAFHPLFKKLADIRKALGTRTVFNLLGPLVNPARPELRLVGVYDAAAVFPMAQALKLMGVRRALVVHGSGLDELNPCGANTAALVTQDGCEEVDIDARQHGVLLPSLDSLVSQGPLESASRIRRLLAGEGDQATRKIVALNAGAALWVAQNVSTLKEGIQKAMHIIDSGQAFEILLTLQHLESGRERSVGQ